MTTPKAQRRRIKRFVRPLAKMPTWKAYEWIADAKPRTLAATLRAMQACTETNCWFGDYHTARVLLPVVMSYMPPNYCSAAKNDIAPPPNPTPKPHHTAE